MKRLLRVLLPVPASSSLAEIPTVPIVFTACLRGVSMHIAVL
jgi:hypothetical protein